VGVSLEEAGHHGHQQHVRSDRRVTRHRRTTEPTAVPDNLAPLARVRHYRFDMLDGETISGLLLDVGTDGTASIELLGGTVIHRACGQIRHLTLSEANPTDHRP
jgi:hypothetical protein